MIVIYIHTDHVFLLFDGTVFWNCPVKNDSISTVKGERK